MKKIAILLSIIFIAGILATSIGAYDYYGKLLPDYLYVADSMTQSVSAGCSQNGIKYDPDTERVYSCFLPNVSASKPDSGEYIQISIPKEANAGEYKFIKLGYRGLTKNDTSAKNTEISIGTESSLCHTTPENYPYLTLDGEHREVVIDVSLYDNITSDNTYGYIRIKPWGYSADTRISQTSSDYFKLEYVAFFKTKADAESYTTQRHSLDAVNGSVAFSAFISDVQATKMTISTMSDTSNNLPFLRFTPTVTSGTNAPDDLQFHLYTEVFENFDINKTPILKLCYRSNIKSSKQLDLNIGAVYGTDGVTARLWGPKINYTADGKWHTLTLDLSALKYTGGDSGYYAPADGETIWDLVSNVKYLRIKPYYKKTVLDGEYFDVLYYGFFKSIDEADNYTNALPNGFSILGDTDADGNITPADEIILSRSLTEPALKYNDNYDIDGDKAVTAIDHTILARHIAGWKKNEHLNISYVDTAYVDTLNNTFEERRDEILNSESNWELGAGGEIYYVSPNGNDSNNGKSESSAWKTTKNLTSWRLSAGDVVLFERGGIWRTNLTAVAGVTYSAYGEGDKPAFYGSVDGSDPADWTEISENLWKFTDQTFSLQNTDVGNIVFDHGKAYGARVFTNNGVALSVGLNGITSNGIETWKSRNNTAFSGESELNHDLEYYLNPSSGYLFVYSSKGNPAERFESVEISKKGNIIIGKSNCVFDNLAMKYGASHGFSVRNTSNVTVRNCEVGWIGGALQNYSTSKTTRFGNGIQAYENSDGFYVYNNFVYECFDCGVTVQYNESSGISNGTSIKHLNNLFYDNVIERCNSPLEAWIIHNSPKENTFMFMNNTVFENNLCRSSGYGFGGYIHTKTGYNMFYGGVATKAVMSNCFVRNNTMWNMRNMVILSHSTTTHYGKGFIWEGNTIVKDYNTVFGQISRSPEESTEHSNEVEYSNARVAMLEYLGYLGRNIYKTVFQD